MTATAARPGLRVPSLAEAVSRTPTGLLLAPLVVLLGVGILAWDYALLPADPIDHVVYWIGLAIAYAGIVTFGLAGEPGARRHLAAVALLGVVMWIPYYLRSPDRLIFVDELFHRDILARILATGHATGQPQTLFALPGTFPGLESAAVSVIGWTGLSMDAAIRLLTLGIHATIPALVYLGARGVELGRRGAFLAALVYAANTSFSFFHSIFSYETLGILLFLAVWALLALYRAGPGRDAGRATGDRRHRSLLLVAVPLLAGIAVTHHISSYVLAISLLVGWVAARIARSPSSRALRDLAVLSVAFDLAWFAVSFDRVGPYLGTSLTARLQTVLATFTQQSGPRTLFANPDQPQLERLLAFSYPPLILVIAALGIWVAWTYRGRSVLWLSFALVGPIAWVLTTPAVFTRSGELAYRSWPFLFLGLAIFVALGLLELARRIAELRPGLARPVVFALVAVLLFGGISIGENQAGRFPTAPKTAAGSAANTPDVVAAAEWLRRTAGPGHVVATDVGTAVPFATDGQQRILGWAAWYPFLVDDPEEVASFVRESEVDYLVLDRRITQLPPRYGAYFGAPPVPTDMDPGVPVPADVVATLDDVPSLTRIYAGANIVIYRVDPDVAVPGGG